MAATGWKPLMDFEQGLTATIDWYKANQGWTARVKSGEYRSITRAIMQGVNSNARYHSRLRLQSRDR